MLQVCPGGSRAAHRQADWFLGLRRAANFDLPERGRGEARLASADSLRSHPAAGGWQAVGLALRSLQAFPGQAGCLRQAQGDQDAGGVEDQLPAGA
jgi:hypothetical protein